VAADLARACDAALRIVHAVPPVQYRVGRLAPTRAVPRRLGDPFNSPVLADARELAWLRGVAATLALLAGEPVAGMVTAAAANAQADLLVIGARSAERPRRRTAPTRQWIEAHAPCPTVTPRTASVARHLGWWRRSASASPLAHDDRPDLVSGHAEESS
jgi:nucleotide-binding universal stress UspA family protein